MLKYILQKMSLITREGKGSKLTIEELDNNLLGLNNMTFVGENLSNYIGDLENIQLTIINLTDTEPIINYNITVDLEENITLTIKTLMTQEL